MLYVGIKQKKRAAFHMFPSMDMSLVMTHIHIQLKSLQYFASLFYNFKVKKKKLKLCLTDFLSTCLHDYILFVINWSCFLNERLNYNLIYSFFFFFNLIYSWSILCCSVVSRHMQKEHLHQIQIFLKILITIKDFKHLRFILQTVLSLLIELKFAQCSYK